MRAVLCEDWCDFDDLKLTEIAPPPMRPGGVRIRTHFAGISFAVSLVVAGRYQRRPPLPFAPGTEVAGEVLEVADGVARCKPGDRVVASVDWGGFAEQVVAAEENVFVLPDGLPLEDAVPVPMAYGTSYGAVVWRAELKPGQSMLVHGAAGGVGLAAVEIGKALGAAVIASASTDEKRALLKERGADAVLDSRETRFRETVRDLTGGRGVDVVFDPIGGAVFHESLRALAVGGKLVTIGYASGEIPQIGINLLLLKNIGVMGFNWGGYVGWGPVDERKRYASEVKAAMDRLFAWWREGRINPTVHRRFDLAQFREAMAEVRERRSVGRVVLEP